MNNSRGCLKYFHQSTVGYSDCSKYLIYWNEYSNIIYMFHIDLRISFIKSSLSFTFCKKNWPSFFASVLSGRMVPYSNFANVVIFIEQALTSRWYMEKLGKCFQIAHGYEKYCFSHSFDIFSWNTLRCFQRVPVIFMHSQRISKVASSYLRNWWRFLY